MGEGKGPGVPAAKVTYNVYVVDKHPTKHPSWENKNDFTKSGILQQLSGYFEQIADKAGYTGAANVPKARVNWVSSLPASIGAHELACYLIPKANSAFGSLKAKAHGQGMTAWLGNSAMLSEVWVETLAQFSLNNFIDMMSKIIFHEWMHQKLDAHPNDATNDIHNRANGLGLTPVETTRDFADGDRDDMAAALPKNYPQKRA